ncbi:DUF3017 domain-containing protein [Streptomyces sp. NBC_01317]|uniref:DUF3017 domain-containing protein n=1 Tax=Streptomyces sp. NBC_01317 TaxID=2903822 RepID=UPI002E162BDB|nr:DUF3017 domain-containing protein [Streptomyces sp. NBC_01317]
MGAGTSASDTPEPNGVRQAVAVEPGATGAAEAGADAGVGPDAVVDAGVDLDAGGRAGEGPDVDANVDPRVSAGARTDARADAVADTDPDEVAVPAESTSGGDPDADSRPEESDSESESRRFPAVTTDTARPEGGGRAAPPDAPAPARQWPLLSVLGTVGLGLLVVGTHPFDEAFRIGTILIGIALIGGAVLRRVLPSVGMLAVRSRFTDMVTYGLLGLVIIMLALMTQPKPWLEIPFLEDIVHSTVP